MNGSLNMDASGRQIKQKLTEILKNGSQLRRKQLIEQCVSFFGFTESQLNDHAPTSIVTLAKSRIGTVLSEMLSDGNVSESEIGFLTLESTPDAVFELEDAVDYVLTLLADGAVLSKRRILDLAQTKFGEASGESKDIRAVTGSALAKLEREKRVLHVRKGYTLPPTSHLPNTELGHYLHTSKTTDDLLHCYVNAVHIKGGEWFESYCVELISGYYSKICHQKVLEASVMGGSNDGGIDGLIRTTDWLGFSEKTLMQMKNRRATMTEKDLREFYGAVCAQQGTRGIFITISQFHPGAIEFMDKIDNLIGLDGAKLFEIAKLCKFGIVEQDGRLMLDEKVFLDK